MKLPLYKQLSFIIDYYYHPDKKQSKKDKLLHQLDQIEYKYLPFNKVVIVQVQGQDDITLKIRNSIVLLKDNRNEIDINLNSSINNNFEVNFEVKIKPDFLKDFQVFIHPKDADANEVPNNILEAVVCNLNSILRESLTQLVDFN